MGGKLEMSKKEGKGLKSFNKGFQVPDTYIIIFLVVVVAALLTFLVPKGCMVKINAAIWHLCPLPANNEVLHAMIVLPECTYANDCTVVEFEEKDWFKIIL